MKYRNVSEYLADGDQTREDLTDVVCQAALLLANNCKHNFEGNAGQTEDVAVALYHLKEILDTVE